MSTKRYIRTINFDLDTKALKQYYPGKSYRKAYKDIKAYMQQNGFEHRQWSGYKSKAPLSDMEVVDLISRMARSFDWLNKCVNRIDVANVDFLYDLKDIVSEASNAAKSEITQDTLRVKGEERQTVLSDLLNEAKKQAEEINKDRSKNIHRNKDIEL